MVFKQLLQANAIDVCQIDSCRLAGINEILGVMLMAAKFGVPVVSFTLHIPFYIYQASPCPRQSVLPPSTLASTSGSLRSLAAAEDLC
jgi:hypothetical protein